MGDVEKIEEAKDKEARALQSKLDAAQSEAAKLMQAAQEERRLRLKAEGAVRLGEPPRPESGASSLCVLQ